MNVEDPDDLAIQAGIEGAFAAAFGCVNTVIGGVPGLVTTALSSFGGGLLIGAADVRSRNP